MMEMDALPMVVLVLGTFAFGYFAVRTLQRGTRRIDDWLPRITNYRSQVRCAECGSKFQFLAYLKTPFGASPVCPFCGSSEMILLQGDLLRAGNLKRSAAHGIVSRPQAGLSDRVPLDVWKN
jgi:Zn finger protein HypA/HybF involved in hydrogenase expression